MDLQEKESEKKEKAEEKEQQKQERLMKKQLKEEELKRKQQEKVQKQHLGKPNAWKNRLNSNNRENSEGMHALTMNFAVYPTVTVPHLLHNL